MDIFILPPVSTQFWRQLFSGFVIKMDETTTPYSALKFIEFGGFSAEDE